MTRNLKWKSNFGEINIIDIKTKEENSKYEKSWKKITVEGNKRVKAIFIWKTIKLINDTWRIEKTWIFYIYINMTIQCSCFCEVASVVSDSVRPHRRHPARLSIPGILQTRTQEWVAISFSSAWKWEVKVKSLSRVRLLATPWTAGQAPPSMGFFQARALEWVASAFSVTIQ